MRLRIAVLPGDGIGPEVVREAERVLRAVADLFGHTLDLSHHQIGAAAIHTHGCPLPRHTLDACLESDAVLLGAVGDPRLDHLPAAERPEAGLLALRRALGGFANLRPVATCDALLDCSSVRPEVARGTDILIIRELLGGIYFGEPRGWSERDGQRCAFNTMTYTADEVGRVARLAFEAASRRRHKLTSVDKANVLETSQLWRQVVIQVSKDYPQVRLEHLYVDSCALALIQDPLRFDVILTENLFGDILSDEAAVLAGSLGLLASATIGGQVDLYEPVHGSAPDLAGRDLANPIGAIASAALLLRHTAKLELEASAIEVAIQETLEQGARTPDLARGSQRRRVGTTQMGSQIAQMAADAVERQHPYHAV